VCAGGREALRSLAAALDPEALAGVLGGARSEQANTRR
jgi:hypothetical protein